MSFEIDGVTWQPESAAEHAANMLAAINTYRSGLGLSQLVANPGNAIWLILLGAGTGDAQNDEELNAAQNSLIISNTDDNQILNLIPIAGTQLIPATFSTITVHVVAGSGGSAVIPAGTHCVISGLPDVTFLTGDDTTILASHTADIVCTASVSGPVVVVPGQITGFIETISNVSSVTNAASSIPGSDEETPAQVRTRLLQGNVLSWGINGLIRALLAIPGITQAVAYFNKSTTVDLDLPGGITIAPRHAHMYVIGEDTSDIGIANAYIMSMNAPTDGAETQDYTTLAGQSIAINYDFAGTQEIYVKVYYDADQPQSAGFQTLIEDAVLTITPSIGQTQSSEIVLSVLQNFLYATILGATVSTDNVTYSNKAVIDADSIAVYTRAKITVVAG